MASGNLTQQLNQLTMITTRKLLLIFLCFIFCSTSKAQLQLDYLSFKGFSSIGFGGFFNFSVPVSDANYVTGELGLDVFSRNDEHVALAPMLVGYRYTLDGTGTGFYLEPNLGYSFAGTDIQITDAEGNYTDQKVGGLSTGIGLGYLFQPSGMIQFNLGLRYEHIFGDVGSNMFSFRISHAFIFGRRE
jgi:hypothetical protein